MKRINFLLTFLAAGLRLLYVVLTVRAVILPYYPYIRFTFKNRREAREAWSEVQAIRRLI